MAQTGEDLHVNEKTGGPLLGANMLLLQKTKAHDDVPNEIRRRSASRCSCPVQNTLKMAQLPSESHSSSDEPEIQLRTTNLWQLKQAKGAPTSSIRQLVPGCSPLGSFPCCPASCWTSAGTDSMQTKITFGKFLRERKELRTESKHTDSELFSSVLNCIIGIL